MSDAADQIRALTERLDRVEAQLEIARLMASYGPAVDSGAGAVAAALWAEDGVYDAGVAVFPSAEAIATMVHSEPHQTYVRDGCAHLVGPPHITVNGDEATAITHAQLMFWNAETSSYRVWRVTANVWQWRRDATGWKVVSRINRPLDGTDAGRDLFRQTLS